MTYCEYVNATNGSESRNDGYGTRWPWGGGAQSQLMPDEQRAVNTVKNYEETDVSDKV